METYQIGYNVEDVILRDYVNPTLWSSLLDVQHSDLALDLEAVGAHQTLDSPI